jgi:hypothetical protein
VWFGETCILDYVLKFYLFLIKLCVHFSVGKSNYISQFFKIDIIIIINRNLLLWTISAFLEMVKDSLKSKLLGDPNVTKMMLSELCKKRRHCSCLHTQCDCYLRWQINMKQNEDHSKKNFSKWFFATNKHMFLTLFSTDFSSVISFKFNKSKRLWIMNSEYVREFY